MSTDNVRHKPTSLCGAKVPEVAYQKPIEVGGRGGNNHSRPRNRAIAVVSRLTVLVPPTLFDRGRSGGRKGKN